MDGPDRSDFDSEHTPESSQSRGTPRLPRISDYWPDNPPRVGPGIANFSTEGPADRVRYPFQPGAAAVSAFRDDDTLTYNQIYPANDDLDFGDDGRGTSAYGRGRDDPAATHLISTPPPRRPRLRVTVAAASIAVFLGLSGVGLVRLVSTYRDDVIATAAPAGGQATAGEPSPPVSISPSAVPSSIPVASPTSGRSSAPAAGAPAFAAGTFVLADNVTEINLAVGRPAKGAIQAGTPSGSGLTTRTVTSGTTVTLTVKPTGKPGSGRVDVLLDSRIAWTIKMTGGVKNGTFALTGGIVRGFDLVGGADTLDIALPRTSGAMPIRMSGGVHTWRIRTEREEPVRVQVRAGAGAVTLYGKSDGGVDKGKEVTAGSGTGLEIDAVAGVGSLTVSAG
jgi:hypothetical protein